MNLGLEMSLKLQQKLSFQMIQSLKLLQVNTLQLQQLIRNELETNPLLEIVEEREPLEEDKKSESVSESEEEDEIKASEDEVDWDQYIEEAFDLGYSFNEERDPNEEKFEPVPVYTETLDEHLSKQLSEKKIPENIKLLAEFIIGTLDADGYLRIPFEEISEQTRASIYEIKEALNVIQKMDPPGVGARDLRECMIIQLKARGKHDSLSMRIVSEGWDLFEKMKIPELARRFNVEPKEIQSAIEELKTLDPRPGHQFFREKSTLVVPDLIVEKIDGKFVVMLNDRSIPSLKISNAYAKILKNGKNISSEVRKFIKDKFNSASWLIRAIEQRKTTMIRVMYAIIEKQKEFFEKGPPNLKPLKLQDIAEMVNMHISTISRVTNNKYVQTPHGIFELKYFFTEGVSNKEKDGTEEEVSSEKIKIRIKELIENEDKKEPLSDQKIAELLKKEGMAVARRTVAKYREQLKLLPARMRIKYD
ncbi:MAG: RNA polymerase factor sigma-54 [Chitinispirillaceae bacterium]|nr:RNA polymerase factor sigma-54 [Chitinispirillaceae bacterium]